MAGEIGRKKTEKWSRKTTEIKHNKHSTKNEEFIAEVILHDVKRMNL